MHSDLIVETSFLDQLKTIIFQLFPAFSSGAAPVILRLKLTVFSLFVATVLTCNLQADLFVPSDLNVGDEYRIVFVTFGNRDANATDISFYNNYVNAEASLGSLTGDGFVDYFAIASTLGTNAIDNVGLSSAPIYNLNGERVGTGTSDLFDGTLDAQIIYNQFGIFSAEQVWTGTQSNGTAFPGAFLGSGDPRIGNNQFLDGQYLSNGFESSNTQLSFYGISEVLIVPVPEPGSMGLCMLALGAVGFVRRRRA